jgi:TonB family protein
MRNSSVTMWVLTAFVASFCAADGLRAQSMDSSNAPEDGVVLIRLSPPTYPRIALTAQISGDVDLSLSVHQDGSIESVAVVSGPPLLQRAAVSSAQQSQFECRKCGDGSSSYRLLYTFQLGPTSYCTNRAEESHATEQEQPYPRVTQAENHVTVIDQPVAYCDQEGIVVGMKVRSAKCLYLWKCGLR